MTPHEIEAMTPAELALELGWSPWNPSVAGRWFLERVRDYAVRDMRRFPVDVVENAEGMAAAITLAFTHEWQEHAERLALILLRAYSPEES